MTGWTCVTQGQTLCDYRHTNWAEFESPEMMCLFLLPEIMKLPGLKNCFLDNGTFPFDI